MDLAGLRALTSADTWSFPPRPHTHHVRWIEAPIWAPRIACSSRSRLARSCARSTAAGPEKSWPRPSRCRKSRVGGITEPGQESIEEPLTVLAELKREGLIRHIGLSNISPQQLVDAQAMTEIVCVQNFYKVARRNDDAFIDDLTPQGIAYAPFFPLGGFTPLQSSALDAAAALLKATPMQVALAWLLRRSPNILLIPGTSSLAHLR